MAAVAGTEVGRCNTLVGVRSLLDLDLLVGRLARAAADGDEPEEAGGDREGDAEPEDGEHLGAERSLDIVGLENGFEDADEDGVDGGRSSGSSDDKDGLSLQFC